jgi:hypothetical protein
VWIKCDSFSSKTSRRMIRLFVVVGILTVSSVDKTYVAWSCRWMRVVIVKYRYNCYWDFKIIFGGLWKLIMFMMSHPFLRTSLPLYCQLFFPGCDSIVCPPQTPLRPILTLSLCNVVAKRYHPDHNHAIHCTPSDYLALDPWHLTIVWVVS